jgi:methionyl aminopeptidase
MVRRRWRLSLLGRAKVLMNLLFQKSAPDKAEVVEDEGEIPLYGPDAFAGMHRAGQLAAEALDMLVPHVRPGVSTQRLDDLVFAFAMDHKALPATLNYRGYTKSSCISINHVVCHGIPGPKVLREGDILNIDVTLIVDGWHGDTSRMYAAGQPNRKAERLIEVTYECLMRGIAAVKPGAFTGDIGRAIEDYAHANRCSVVEDFCGHGVGDVFHQRPNILHYRVNAEGKDAGPGIEMKPGMIFTIEPMINLGKPYVKLLNDGWTAVTRDRELSAQFEHSIGVTQTGHEVFTISPRGWHKPPYARTA